MGEPILVRLESAEMLARERRLLAASEAERRVAAARVAAATVEAGTDDAIREAVDALRERHRRRAAEEVAVIERQLAGLDRETAVWSGRGGPQPEGAPRDDRFEDAVDFVVRAVLAEKGG